MKKLLSFLLSVVIILSGFIFAFADDDSASVSDFTSGSDAELSEAENDFLSKSTSESDFEVRKAIINSVRSVSPPTGNETASDIYELLYSCWTSINLHYSLYVYDDQNYSVNSDIRTTINAIASSLQGTTGSATGDIWSLLKQIVRALTLDTNSNLPGDYTIHHNVDLISQFIANGLFDANQNPFLQGIESNLTTVSSNLASQMNQIVFIRNKIDSIDSNVDFIQDYTSYISEATEQVIVPRIEHIDDDLHNLKQWFENTFYYVDESISQSDYVSRINLNRYGGPDGVYQYPYTGGLTTSLPNDGGLKCIIPFDLLINNHCVVCYPFNDNVQVSINNNVSSFYSFNCSVYVDRQYYIYSAENFTNLNIEYTDHILKIEFDVSDNIVNQYNYMYFVIGNKITITGSIENMTPYTFAIVNEKKSYLQHIDNDLHLGYDILNTFKELYASDDLINAKENQKLYEDQVIDDFTGSGSAAAKASDAASAKDISSAISSGLSSGGSVNNSLGVFNTNSGFWAWFSQENSDYINNLSSQNRLRSSGSGSDWVIYDPYQRNAEELQSILGGDR